jgi:hypothetical protein
MALGPLAAAADLAPEFGTEARRLIGDIETRVTAWDEETPVSTKLVQLLQDDAWNSETTALIIPDRRTADVYLSADRTLGVRCEIADARGLLGILTSSRPTRMIVVGPTPEVVRALRPHEMRQSGCCCWAMRPGSRCFRLKSHRLAE